MSLGMTVGWDMIGSLDNGQPLTQETDGPPLSQHYGVWPSKTKLGPAAVSTALSLSHSSVECKLSLEPPPRRLPAHQKQDLLHRFPHRAICYQQNDTPSPMCNYPNFRYDHICYICAMSPTARSVDYKAIHCPYQSANNQPAPHPPRRQFTSLRNT